MKKLSAKGMKALKAMHLICAIAWFGSAISMNLLRHLVEVEDAAGMYWMAEILEAIDMKILVPGAIGCLLTGIVYGAFTNWSFFRHIIVSGGRAAGGHFFREERVRPDKSL